MRFFLIFTSGTQNILCVARPFDSAYCRDFKGKRKINTFIQDRKYITIHQHFLNQSIKVLSQIWGLRIWFSSRKFDHEMNLKGLFCISYYLDLVLFSTILIERWRKFLLESFWESLLSEWLYCCSKIFKRNFWDVSVISKCFQSLRIEPIIRLNILYGLQ